MSLAAALISGGAGLISSQFNIGSQNRANEANERLARENREFYFQQWQRENAYNDPSAVMARMARAGLNPSLMYGDGAGSLSASASMNPTDVAQMRAPTIDPLMAAQIGNITADTALKKNEAKKAETDIDVNKGIIKVNESTVLYNSALTDYTRSQRDYIIGKTKMLGTITDEANSRIALNMATIENMSEQTKIAWANNALKDKEVEALCKNYEANTQLSLEELKYYSVLVRAKILGLNSEAVANYAAANLSLEQAKKVQQEAANLKIIGNQLQWDYQMSQDFGVATKKLELNMLAAEIASKQWNSTTANGYPNSGFRKRFVNDMQKFRNAGHN